MAVMWRFDAAQEADCFAADLAVDLELFVDVRVAAIQRRRQQKFFDRSRLGALNDPVADERVDHLVSRYAAVAVVLTTVDAVQRRRPAFTHHQQTRTEFLIYIFPD